MNNVAEKSDAIEIRMNNAISRLDVLLAALPIGSFEARRKLLAKRLALVLAYC